ncbi:MAG: ParB/RepB/Spo0J family partition protein [Elusimicrobia bacterium]|nr:ParB/RepB/Spo0J family partition protein [Elusimicrobiota bacterium]
MVHKALGRGLGSLIPGAEKGAARSFLEQGIKIHIDRIKPNRNQPRERFDETKLRELSESIEKHGLAQPILVTPSKIPGEYELIAGERRLRACRMAGLKEVWSVVRNTPEDKRFQLSLIENIQRENLNPIEEGKAYKKLMDDFDHTQEELSKLVAKDRAVIANTLRLLNLPEDIQESIAEGLISAGHGRMLAGISDEEKQKHLAEKIVKEKLTVREIERLIAEWKAGKIKGSRKSRKAEPELKYLAEELQRKLGTKINISGTSKKGKIGIHYYSLEELERITKILGVKI